MSVDLFFFYALLEKKDKQFSTTAVSLYSVRFIIYKRLKNVFTLSGLWWEDAGKK